MTQRYHKLVSIDQALIMALKMHDRGHCSLAQAVIAGLELRYQLNVLDMLGISYEQIQMWLHDAQEGDIIEKGE